ncbi:MAG: hypothetical protein ACK5L0_00360 [Candidatus Fimivivens sp.]
MRIKMRPQNLFVFCCGIGAAIGAAQPRAGCGLFLRTDKCFE